MFRFRAICYLTNNKQDESEEERMSTDKDKALIDAASDRLRETTGAFKGEGPWHSANSDVYHNNHS